MSEVERVLRLPDCSTLLGTCDRAIIETLYSAGLRRMEVIGLDVGDLDSERGTVFVRGGKGDRDRVVPIGDRALAWIGVYRDWLDNERGRRGIPLTTKALFLNGRWRRIRATKLTERLHRYIVAAGIQKPGSVHIFRHTMATLMHDGGADIRDLQEMLGHAQLTTTEIYTHVSIGRLKSVHRLTHPAERDRK
jgi:integrase/recombinase XerD